LIWLALILCRASHIHPSCYLLIDMEKSYESIHLPSDPRDACCHLQLRWRHESNLNLTHTEQARLGIRMFAFIKLEAIAAVVTYLRGDSCVKIKCQTSSSQIPSFRDLVQDIAAEILGCQAFIARFSDRMCISHWRALAYCEPHNPMNEFHPACMLRICR
jgi:hypothetical protein